MLGSLAVVVEVVLDFEPDLFRASLGVSGLHLLLQIHNIYGMRAPLIKTGQHILEPFNGLLKALKNGICYHLVLRIL